MDNAIERIVNPLRAIIEADGDKLYVNVNYVAFTGQITDGIYPRHLQFIHPVTICLIKA